jgi:hypothetical protein
MIDLEYYDQKSMGRVLRTRIGVSCATLASSWATAVLRVKARVSVKLNAIA